MFSHIILEPEQKDVLNMVVEASRNVTRESRQKFTFVKTIGGSLLFHPGLGRVDNIYIGDIETLARYDLIALSSKEDSTRLNFDVTPFGFRYYEYLKSQSSLPIEQIENSIRNFLDGQIFQQKYPLAYQKWVEAERKLWGSESEQQLTIIGHLCRESMQEFVTTLVNRYKPKDVSDNKAHTISRMRAVLNTQEHAPSSTVKEFLSALLTYWGAIHDLVQRQEHGGQKEGTPLVWEDGRRIVFNIAIVMYEIDRTLS